MRYEYDNGDIDEMMIIFTGRIFTDKNEDDTMSDDDRHR